jgi:hypothetical protein
MIARLLCERGLHAAEWVGESDDGIHLAACGRPGCTWTLNYPGRWAVKR